MRSIERRYKRVTKQNPIWSNYLCFVETIKRQKFSKIAISKWFRKLVHQDEYFKGDKRDILKHLCNLSNDTEDVKKLSKIQL
jgi:hypothetical protein